jgi:hypothetical protein
MITLTLLLTHKKFFITKSVFKIQFLSYKFESNMVKRISDDLLGKLLSPEESNFDLRATKWKALKVLMAKSCT